MSSPGYFKYRHRPLSPTMMRRQWLTGLIREAHTASRGTYGSRRVHAELTRGMDVTVSEPLVAELKSRAGIACLPGPAKVKRFRGFRWIDPGTRECMTQRMDFEESANAARRPR